MTFWISQDKVATADRWGGQIYKILMLNFPRISHTPKIVKNRLIFDKVIQQTDRQVDRFLGTMYICMMILTALAWRVPRGKMEQKNCHTLSAITANPLERNMKTWDVVP